MSENEDHPKKRGTLKIVLIIMVALLILGGAAIIGARKASEKPAFCLTCHNMKPYYESWNQGNLLAHKHDQAGINCHKCHQTTVKGQIHEGISFVTGNYKTPLDKRNFGTRKFCLTCHNFDEVKSKTNFAESNPHDSHNGEQQCNVCHNMHRQSKVMCAECHQFEWMNKLGSEWAK